MIDPAVFALEFFWTCGKPTFMSTFLVCHEKVKKEFKKKCGLMLLDMNI